MSSVSRNSLKIFLFISFLFPTIAQAAITVLHDANVAGHFVSTHSTDLTITSTTAGNFVAVVCSTSNYSSFVNILGVSDSAGDTFTLAPSTTSTSAANNNNTMAIYYTNSISAAQTTVTCNFAVTGSYTVEIWAWEFSGVTSPLYDVGGVVNAGTGAGTTVNGPTLLTTGKTEWGVAGVSTFQSITANPKGGNAWNSGGGAGMIDSDNDAATGLIAASPGSTAPVWTDSAGGVAYNSSAATWYVSLTTTSSIQGNSTIRGNSTVN